MANKSIIDRVLLLAALVCAAGLIWQLTVLLTTKGKAPAARTIAIATSPAAGTSPAVGTSAAAAPTNTSAEGAGLKAGSAPEANAKPAMPQRLDAASAPEAAAPAPPATPTVRVVYPGVDAPAPKATAKIIDTPSAAPVTPLAGNAPDLVPVSLVSPAAPASVPPAPAAPAPAPVVATADPAPPAEPAPKPAGSGININNASVEALNRLEGGGHIGQAIASHRPYKSVDDLVKKRVLRRDVFERIRGQIAAE